MHFKSAFENSMAHPSHVISATGTHSMHAVLYWMSVWHRTSLVHYWLFLQQMTQTCTALVICNSAAYLSNIWPNPCKGSSSHISTLQLPFTISPEYCQCFVHVRHSDNSTHKTQKGMAAPWLIIQCHLEWTVTIPRTRRRKVWLLHG
jgi:hypothetical protein